MKILITGTGRSGTGYISQVLRHAGIRCGHENVYHPTTRSSWEWGDYEAESSWLAVPYLEPIIRAHRNHVLVVHLVRHPVACARSLLHFFKTDDTHFHDAIRRFAPWILDDAASPIERFCRYWVTWQRHADAYADLRVRIEDTTGAPDSFRGMLAHAFTASRWRITTHTIDSAMAAVPKDYNTRHDREDLAWRDLAATTCGEIIEQIACAYGYEAEDST